MNANSKFPISNGEKGSGQAPGAGPALGSDTNAKYEDAAKDRTYNPVDGAPSGSVSASLNSDAARFKKGPGPL